MTLVTLFDENGQPVQVDLEDSQGQPQGQGQDRSNSEWAEKRRAEKEARDAKATNAALLRENTMLKAGIPVTDPAFQYFVKGYDGDITVEAIKAAATAAGFVDVPAGGAPAPTPPAGTVAGAKGEGADAGAVISQASQGAAGVDLHGAELLANTMETGGKEALLTVLRENGIPVV